MQHNPMRLSAVEYFKNKLQEKHSTFNNENIWKNDFNFLKTYIYYSTVLKIS